MLKEISEKTDVPRDVEAFFEKYIKPLSASDRSRLMEIIVQDMANRNAASPGEKDQPKCSLLELEGSGAKIWEGVDAQQYVHQLRDKWDHRP